MQFLAFKSLKIAGLYTIMSLLCAALVTLVPAWFLSQLVSARLLEHAAAVYQYFVQEIVEDLDARAILPELPSSSPPMSYDYFFTQTAPDRIDAIFSTLAKFLLRQPGMVRISVYGPDSRRIWSTNSHLTGHLNLSNAKLIRALTSTLSVSAKHQIWDINAAEKTRVTEHATIFSEMYLPIWSPSRDGIVGAVELYKVSDPLFKTIAQSQRWIWGGAIVVGFLLYIVLLGLRSRVARFIASWRERQVPPRLRPPQSLFKFYAALSVLFVALLIVGPTWPLVGYMDYRMLERDAAVTMEFVQTLLEDMDASVYVPTPASGEPVPTYADFFSQTDESRLDTIFGDFCKRIALQALGIVRISVFSPDGMRIWATQPDQEWIRNLGNSKLVSALTGQLAVEMANSIWQLSDAEASRIATDTLIFSEMYMPIWNPDRDRVVGVVEVYRNSETLFNAMTQGQWWFWGSAVVLGLLLLGVLLAIMRQAVRIMAQQRESLVASETLSAVGEMVASIADVLYQPLSAIAASAEEIRAKLFPTTTLQGQDIQTEVDQLESWLQSLRAYSRPDTETDSSVGLSDVVHDLIQQVGPNLDHQKIQLQVDLADNLPLMRVDSTQLYQVLHTVVMNAQEAMPDGGTLSIRASDTNRAKTGAWMSSALRRVDWTSRGSFGMLSGPISYLDQLKRFLFVEKCSRLISATVRLLPRPDWRGAQDTPCIDIQIRDTGCGMTKEQLDQVFHPFFTTKRRGLGIGMALAQRVVERQGGTIAITSTEGQGATVTLSFPIVAEDGTRVTTQ